MDKLGSNISLFIQYPIMAIRWVLKGYQIFFRETQYLYENKQQQNSSYRKKINCKKKKNEKLYFHSSFA